VVAGTSGRPADGTCTPRHLASTAAALAQGGRLALVFGPEATGLTNHELALCHLRVHVPTDPAHPSLNLAQAVLVVAYELRMAWLDARPAPADASLRATAGEVGEALRQLRDGLLGIGYLNSDNPEAVLAELRGIVVRARPSPREVALLRGLARQIAWAAGRIARRGGEDHNP
jgi:TrmH family RNA methyltransferase